MSLRLASVKINILSKFYFIEDKPKEEGETCGSDKEKVCGVCDKDLWCYDPKPYGCGICKKKPVMVPTSKYFVINLFSYQFSANTCTNHHTQNLTSRE